MLCIFRRFKTHRPRVRGLRILARVYNWESVTLARKSTLYKHTATRVTWLELRRPYLIIACFRTAGFGRFIYMIYICMCICVLYCEADILALLMKSLVMNHTATDGSVCVYLGDCNRALSRSHASHSSYGVFTHTPIVCSEWQPAALQRCWWAC